MQIKSLLVLIILYSFNSHSILNIFRERKAFTNNCGNMDNYTGYRTARKACQSGKFSGKRIYECVNKKRKKQWVRVKERVCNSDGMRVGVYVDSCRGEPLGTRNLKEACASGKFKDVNLVKCRNGKQKKVFYCGASGSVNEGDRDVAIFENTCLGKRTEYKRNLKNACLLNKGKTLVRCKNVCTRRVGLKCVQRVWKEQKSAYCNDGANPYTNNKVKFINCNPKQRTVMIKAIEDAKKSVPNVMNQIQSASTIQSYPDKTRKKLRAAYTMMSKIKNKLTNWNMRINCQEEMRRCSSGPNAHTFWTELNSIKVCRSYFTKSEDEWRAAVLVHEISHLFYSADAEDFSESSPPKDGTIIPWHQNAETYDYWIQHGFCVPEITCKVK